MKRPISFILAVLIVWGSVTQPARAFLPPVALAAYMTASTGAGTYTIAALAGAIGVTGMYLTLKDTLNNEVRIPVGPNAVNEPPKPVAAVSTSSVTANVATCSAYDIPYGSGAVSGNFTATTIQDACSAACASIGGGSASFTTYNCTTGYKTYAGSNSQQTTCPSGYSLSGGSCQLVNSRQVTDDKKCDILVSNGQFATASDLNCPSVNDGSKIAPMIRNGKVIAYGTNSEGQPLMWEVTPGAQNYIVREYQQIQTATQTQIKTTTVMVDTATSAVTSVQSSTAPGSMSSPAASSVPTTTDPVANPTTATNTPTVTQDQTKPADSVTCGLPGTPACAIDDTQFDGKDNFTTPRNSEINDKLDQNKTQLENSKDSIPTIGADWLPSLMPGNVTACVPLVFDFTLHNRITGTLAAPNVQLDICDKLELVRAILGYMLGMWTVWYVWRRFTTANQGA